MKIYSGLVSLLLLGACAGRIVQKEKLDNVNKVAIVGFELVQKQPKDFEISFGSSDSDMPMSSMGVSKPPVNSAHASEIYHNLRKRFKNDFNWEMSPPEKLIKNVMYAASLKDQMSGFRSIPPVPANTDVFSVEGVMDWWAWEKLDVNTKASLIKSLNADAVLVVAAQSDLTESASFKMLVGGGNFKPQVTYRVKMYSGDTAELIWWDYNLKGNPTDKTVGHFAGISNKDALNKLVIEAANEASALFKKSTNKPQ